MFRSFLCVVLGSILGHAILVSFAFAQDGIDENWRVFVKQHCAKCHQGEKAEADLDLTTLPFEFSDPLYAEKWGEVVNSLNSHEMPPEKEPQPDEKEVARLVDGITSQLADAELKKRATSVVIRRLNRREYDNTMRDLLKIDFSVAGKLPEDPPAGGFDNNGQALSISPLHLELYYAAAREALAKATFPEEKPASILWRFEPEENRQGMDRYRVNRDKFQILLNSGNNQIGDEFTTVHHNSWDKGVNFRGFRVPVEGNYIIRFRSASRVPTREEVVASAAKILGNRRDNQMKEQPKGAKWHEEQYQRDLSHFENDRMYDYGPARIRISKTLAGQPLLVREMDVGGTVEKPSIQEVITRMTTEDAGISFDYAYDIPKVLENFWMQSHDSFARPEWLVDWIEVEGPIYENWPPASHQVLFPADLMQAKDERTRAKSLLKNFMGRAYRRPVDDKEVDRKFALYERAREEGEDFVGGMRSTYAAVLTSPNFLFMVEESGEADGTRKLNDFELATRLSYFLWSSMPDDELTALASEGKLRDADVLKSQIDRMLQDPKSASFVENFCGQWLGLRKVGANPPAENLYPQYDRHLEISMVRESEAFFAEILRNDLDLRNLIKSDFVMINERLARYYGIKGVRGDAMQKVAIDGDSHRGGVVTQASILTITSNGTRTSPVTRGVWVLRTLLGTDPGLPVANAGEIAPKVPGIDKATVRQRLEIHRQLPQCARCHDKIDPLGFALENYNAAGEWRLQEGFGYNGRVERDDPVIDASSKMPDGREINGVPGLQEALLAKEDLFLTAMAKRVLSYALGRELGFADQTLVEEIVRRNKAEKYTLRSMVQHVVLSDSFQTK